MSNNISQFSELLSHLLQSPFAPQTNDFLLKLNHYQHTTIRNLLAQSDSNTALCTTSSFSPNLIAQNLALYLVFLERTAHLINQGQDSNSALATISNDSSIAVNNALVPAGQDVVPFTSTDLEAWNSENSLAKRLYYILIILLGQHELPYNYELPASTPAIESGLPELHSVHENASLPFQRREQIAGAPRQAQIAGAPRLAQITAAPRQKQIGAAPRIPAIEYRRNPQIAAAPQLRALTHTEIKKIEYKPTLAIEGAKYDPMSVLMAETRSAFNAMRTTFREVASRIPDCCGDILAGKGCHTSSCTDLMCYQAPSACVNPFKAQFSQVKLEDLNITSPLRILPIQHYLSKMRIQKPVPFNLPFTIPQKQNIAFTYQYRPNIFACLPCSEQPKAITYEAMKMLTCSPSLLMLTAPEAGETVVEESLIVENQNMDDTYEIIVSEQEKIDIENLEFTEVIIGSGTDDDYDIIVA